MGRLQLPGVGAPRFNSEPTEAPAPLPGPRPLPAGGSEPGPRPAGSSEPFPVPAPPPAPMPPIETPNVPTPIPPAPYPSSPVPSIPFVPASAKTWLQEHRWVLPAGGGVLLFLIGLTIGVASSRKRRAPSL